ncbi:myozenin-1 [Pleurodeles waltl]|uniref:myozenin-1 n=1 Tax=Pleurodeles waltl TaxID=8319 RepID=UPI003709840E
MPLSGTPAPNKRKKSSKLIMELTGNVTAEGDQEGSSLNLGKKISVPRDVMLEELSLLSNRGSKMFKLRQKRVEKFIYENNPDVFSDNSVDHFQKFIPPGTEGGIQGSGYGIMHGSGQMVSSVNVTQYGCQMQQPPIPPPKPGSGGQAGAAGMGHPSGLAGGTEAGTGRSEGACVQGGQQAHKSGGGGGDGKQITVFKTYISPWEKAMGVDPKQATTIGIDLLSIGSKSELCPYKCFNRSAMPYGGYEKASKLMTFQMPEFDATPAEPEPMDVYTQDVVNRPTFNRTPVGWLGSGEVSNLNIELSVPMDGETDEL